MQDGYLNVALNKICEKEKDILDKEDFQIYLECVKFDRNIGYIIKYTIRRNNTYEEKDIFPLEVELSVYNNENWKNYISTNYILRLEQGQYIYSNQ